MLQLVKKIIAHENDYANSEKRRGKDSNNINKIVILYDKIKNLNTNLDTVNKYKNDITKMFKTIKNTHPQTFTFPVQVKEDLTTINLEGVIFFTSDMTGNERYCDLQNMTECECDTIADVTDLGTKIKGLQKRLTNMIDSEFKELYELAGKVGNILHKDVPEGKPTDVYEYINPIAIDYDHNITHIDIMKKLGLECDEKITNISGNRAYILSGKMLQLKHALINYTLSFAMSKD